MKEYQDILFDNRLGCHMNYPSKFLLVRISLEKLAKCYEEFKDCGISNQRLNKNKLLELADEIS